MKISVLTLFPDIVRAFCNESIMARAIDRGQVVFEVVNIRDFATDKHRSCDDAPYGGGNGMVLLPGPLSRALESVVGPTSHVIYPAPAGKPFVQGDAKRLSEKDHLVFIAGRYEGIDERIVDEYVDEQLSIGDYVLSSGEVSSLVIIDAVYRLRDGVITSGSLEEESFEGGLLEYPQYTRPETFHGRRVPEVLLSGHHDRIRSWRHQRRLVRTAKTRPDLLKTYSLSEEDQAFLRDAMGEDDEHHSEN